MKPFIAAFLFVLTFFSLRAQSYHGYNISFVSKINPETAINWYGNNSRYAGCYGWHNAADNKEYAILGSTTGNYFIDISNPANPTVVDFVPGAAQNSLWREIKTYKHYAYLVSDDGGNKLQIVDLSYLPDSVHVVYNSDNLFSRSHTIYIDGNKLYCGGVTKANGSGSYSMLVLSLNNPENPVLLRSLNQDFSGTPTYVHDMFVRNDTVYASCGFDGLYIFHYDSVANHFTLLSSYSNYLQAGYNHSSYLTDNGKTLVFTDEVPANTVVKILDVTNLNNLDLTDTIKSNQGATPHNPYVMGNHHAVVSYYQDGVVVFNISDPFNVSVSGYFDTDTLHGLNDHYTDPHVYQGCWGAYPYLPSGLILASDMQEGLFILNPAQAYGIKNTEQEVYVNIFPNPAQNNTNLLMSSDREEQVSLRIYDISGRQVFTMNTQLHPSLNKISLNTASLASGAYVLNIESSENFHVNKKLHIAR